jgi:hypothetical protein
MRHADIRTTMNVYRDVVTDEMAVASSKVANLAPNGSQDCDNRTSKPLRFTVTGSSVQRISQRSNR